MVYFDLDDCSCGRVSFYLAAEEWVARNRHDDDYFFTWQTVPSVIFGRNQLIENEVNIDYCKRKGICMYRRKSGGGCVYSDSGNLMLSYVTREGNVGFTFNRYLNLVALALFKLGIEAKATGRNDILVDGKKVSGNAFYHVEGRSILHGTLLYDTDMENMTAAITPPTEKLQSKGVESVRQRVALLKDYLSAEGEGIGNVEGLKRHLHKTLCTETFKPSAEEVREIEDIEKEYLADDFIYGHNPSYTVSRSGRIEGVGNVELRFSIKNGIIRRAQMLGDFFVVGDIDNGILRRLVGRPFDKESILQALPDDLGTTVMNLRKEHLAQIIAQAN